MTWMGAQGDGAEERIFFSDESMFPPSAVLSGSSNDRVFPPANVAEKDMPSEEIPRSKQSREVGVMVSV